MISDVLAPEGALSLQLASKTIRWGAKPVKALMLNKTQWVSFNETFERGTRTLPLGRACTLCHRILEPSRFADNQRGKIIRKGPGGRRRFCLECGATRGIYDDKIFLVDGVRSYVCTTHHTVAPLPACQH